MDCRVKPGNDETALIDAAAAIRNTRPSLDKR
jgi:hypothetical protein